MTKLYDDSQGNYLVIDAEGNATVRMGVSVNTRADKPLGYSEWVVSLGVDDKRIMSEQEQAYGDKLNKFTRSGELPNDGSARQEALLAAARAMDEVKKMVDVDPEIQQMGVRVGRFGVRPNEVVGRALQEQYGYKHVGTGATPEGRTNPLDAFLRV